MTSTFNVQVDKKSLVRFLNWPLYVKTVHSNNIKFLDKLQCELSVNFFDELIASSLQILIRHVESRSAENSLSKQFRLQISPLVWLPMFTFNKFEQNDKSTLP